MNLYCDNKAAIGIAHNLAQHDKTVPNILKGIYITSKRSWSQRSLMYLMYVMTDDTYRSVNKLGIRDIDAQTR